MVNIVVDWLSRLRRDEGVSLMRSSLLSVGIKAAGIALVMLVALVLARYLGAAEYGRLAFIQSIAFVLASLSTLGFRESANKIVARYAVRRQRVPLGRFLLFGIVVITMASALSAAIGHAAIAHVPAMRAKYGFPISAMMGLVAGLALLSFLAPVLVTLGRPVLSFAVENIGPRIIVLVAVLVLVASGVPLTANAALNLTVIGNVTPAALLAFLAFVGFRLPIYIRGRFSAVVRAGRAWLCISLCMMTSPLISLVFSETSIIVLGASAPPDDVALYQIARRLAELATVCGAVVTYLALPRIAKFQTERRIDRLQQTIDITNILTILPGLGVMLALLVEGRGILGLFGPAFVGAYTLTLVLSAGRVADQLFGPVLEVLLMTGQHAAASAINVTFAIANIAVNCLLVPAFGQIGAGAGTIAVTLLWKASLYAVLRSRCPVESCLPWRGTKRLFRSATHSRLAVR
ncbi:MAG TPA: lipopolysaccharide biosynthesis protein [Bryobacteraceae bacterium]|nr:lipopolysaccharide biosynthesis protein [Bryobacteraceae bacterium]